MFQKATSGCLSKKYSQCNKLEWMRPTTLNYLTLWFESFVIVFKWDFGSRSRNSPWKYIVAFDVYLDLVHLVNTSTGNADWRRKSLCISRKNVFKTIVEWATRSLMSFLKIYTTPIYSIIGDEPCTEVSHSFRIRYLVFLSTDPGISSFKLKVFHLSNIFNKIVQGICSRFCSAR